MKLDPDENVIAVALSEAAERLVGTEIEFRREEHGPATGTQTRDLVTKEQMLAWRPVELLAEANREQNPNALDIAALG